MGQTIDTKQKQPTLSQMEQRILEAYSDGRIDDIEAMDLLGARDEVHLAALLDRAGLKPMAGFSTALPADDAEEHGSIADGFAHFLLSQNREM